MFLFQLVVLFVDFTILQGAPNMMHYGMESVRLAGFDGPYRGRVEVLFGGQWGSICDEGWDVNAAKVVCRMLSLSGGEPITGAWFGKGDGAIWMSNVNCQGDESSIYDCDYGEANWCSHQQDAGVICEKTVNASMSIRLTTGDNRTYGRLEIYQKNKWSTVCDSLWDDLDAVVACRMLGFKNGIVYKVRPGATPPAPTLMDFIDCVGHEYSLADCSVINWEIHECGDAGVRCS